ncbi:MAG: RcnB family protein [Sphingomonas bacterium]|nr:RcnB family protein [Sphingomonas bacterium]
MKTVLKALLAASALFPVGAYAQNANWQHRGEARADRGDNAQRSDSGRSDWRARRDAGVQTNTQPQIQAPATAETYRRDRGDRGNDAYRQNAQAQANWNQSYRNRDYSNRTYQPRTDRDRRDDSGANAVQRYRDARQPQMRGYAQGYGQRYDNRRSGQWSRDWRNDNRYDWNRYRGVNRSTYRLPRYYAPSGWGYGYRRFSIGVTLSSFLWDQNYWIDDPYAYRLPPAYGPYRWVRYFNDALLIDIRTGVVVDNVYGIFY